MDAEIIHVLATGTRSGRDGVQLADRRANLVRGKRIVCDGLYDELTQQTKKGPVAVHNCHYIQRLIRQGVLAQVTKAADEPAPEKAAGGKGK